MRRKKELPELLAPAGDFESLVAAVRAGADAVYVGGKRYGARAYAKNFDSDELRRAVRYCHLHGVRLYVTVNTLLSDGEIADAVKFAEEASEVGADALIVADVGLISQIRRLGIDIELHASTQMSVHNSLGADFAADLGCKRVVLARELSIENIRLTTEKCRVETEVFLHGALCVCHSGQCLFSSMVGGRSGNRGECAQPCRLPYNSGKYPLSLSDLCLANHVRELIDSGVASLKIEGRMKSPDYVYTVTSIYRRLLDEARNATKDEYEKLSRVFSRSGFTDGYFKGEPQSRMTGVRSEEDKRASREVEAGSYAVDRVAARAKCRIKLGEKSSLTLSLKNGTKSVTVYGAAAEPARSAPLCAADVKSRLMKMGNTFLSLDEGDIELELDEGVNLSPALINALRRDACEALESSDRKSGRKKDVLAAEKPHAVALPAVKSALFLNSDVFREVSAGEGVLSYFDRVFIPLSELSSCYSEVGVYIPPVIPENEIGEVREMLSYAKSRGIRYTLVGNVGHFDLVREFGMIPFGDFRLNITNSFALERMRESGLECWVLSAELNLPAIREVGGGAIVYGRVPLMLTERCFIKDTAGCGKCSRAVLTDRKGIKFPMLREYKHRNLILNSAITYMGDSQSTMRAYGLTSQHFIFTTETPSDVVSVIRAFERGEPMPLDVPIRRMGKR